jgi:hypothetical protein
LQHFAGTTRRRAVCQCGPGALRLLILARLHHAKCCHPACATKFQGSVAPPKVLQACILPGSLVSQSLMYRMESSARGNALARMGANLDQARITFEIVKSGPRTASYCGNSQTSKFCVGHLPGPMAQIIQILDLEANTEWLHWSLVCLWEKEKDSEKCVSNERLEH